MHPTLNIALRAANAAAEKLVYTREHWATLTEESGVQGTLDNLFAGAGKRTVTTLRKAHPDQPVLCEQAPRDDVTVTTDTTHWQTDVMIGETNYVRGLSDCGVLVSQWQKSRLEHLTLVFPFLATEVVASRGRGIHINGRRVRTGRSDRLQGSFMGGGSLTANDLCQRFAQNGADIRLSGCALLDMCRVAAGQLDIAAHGGLSPLEVAAAQLLATESGAVTGDFNGAPIGEHTKSVLSANPRLFKAALLTARQV